MSGKRILELDYPFNPDEDFQKERLVVEEFMGDMIIIFHETYQTYDWKPHDWYSSPEEGILLHKDKLPELIKTLQDYYNNKT